MEFHFGVFHRVEWMNSISSNPFLNILNDIKIILLLHKFPFQLVLIFKTLELSQDSWQQGQCMITMNVSVWHRHFALLLEWTFDSSSFYKSWTCFYFSSIIYHGISCEVKIKVMSIESNVNHMLFVERFINVDIQVHVVPFIICEWNP